MSIFRHLNASINKKTALWMDGDATVGWLHTKHAEEVRKGDMEKLETHTRQNRSEAAH